MDDVANYDDRAHAAADERVMVEEMVGILITSHGRLVDVQQENSVTLAMSRCSLC